MAIQPFNGLRKHDNRGFSALEVIVILCLIAALVKLTVPNLKEFRSRSANRAGQGTYALIRSELESNASVPVLNPGDHQASRSETILFNQNAGSLPPQLANFKLPERVRLNYLINLPQGEHSVVAFEVDPLDGDHLYRYTNVHGHINEQVVKK